MKFEFTDEHKAKYERDGFFVLEKMFDEATCDRLRDECKRLVGAVNIDEHKTVFSMGSEQYKEDYFLNSGDKIRYFWEPKAIGENGELNRDKMLSLNKIGHALHALNDEFQKVTFDEKIKEIYRKLGFIRPVVPQSMYIFKAPNIGGEVNRHIDGSFLYTTPYKLCGIWIALEDVTLQNGCLQFVPGSHKKTEINYRMVRESPGSSVLKFVGEMEQLPYDQYQPMPIKKGSAVMLDGKVHHHSEANTSENSRHVYTFHVVESYKTEWDKQNWLQPTEQLPFSPMYDDSELMTSCS